MVGALLRVNPTDRLSAREANEQLLQLQAEQMATEYKQQLLRSRDLAARLKLAQQDKAAAESSVMDARQEYANLMAQMAEELRNLQTQLQEAQQQKVARESRQRDLEMNALQQKVSAHEGELRKAQRIKLLLEKQVIEGQAEITVLKQTIADQRPDARTSAQPEQAEVCKYFLKGRCRFGDQCRYKHDAPPVCSLCGGGHLRCNCPESYPC